MIKKNKDKVLIIAEAGVNHNGSVDTARQLIDVAADAGADIVKFQTFKAQKVVCRYAQKADYQIKITEKNESQLDMLKKLELNEKAHHILIDHCRIRGIEFLSTPFDLESIDLLADNLNLHRLKIPSGEITNGPYLLHAANTGKPVVLSTGMSTLGEVEEALRVLAFGYLYKKDKPSLEKFHKAFCSAGGQNILRKKVTLLHCTTEYPAPYDQVNIRAMKTMHKAFGLPVGLSDHTPGIVVSIAATALGATVIEKHFTLDKKMPGPDHKTSLDPDELKNMIKAIRQVEAALGNGKKVPMPAEVKNRTVARKSLVAVGKIQQGEVYTSKNLTVKRPGDGISPMRYWEYLGELSDKSFVYDDLIS